jgi:hypothetical protein
MRRYRRVQYDDIPESAENNEQFEAAVSTKSWQGSR